MRFGVITFPGTTGDKDMIHALHYLGHETKVIRHDVTVIPPVDALMIPSGFSYGDYIRPGALASVCPVMDAVKAAASSGMPVIGVGNGFQILCEAGMLPGAFVRNRDLDMICATVQVVLEQSVCKWVDGEKNRIYELPIAHESGCYVCDAETLAELEEEKRVVLRYHGGSPDGSTGDIAGICDEAGVVFGIMPCIERAVEPLTGTTAGVNFIRGIVRTSEGGAR